MRQTENPARPIRDSNARKRASATSAYYGREALLQILRQYEYWDDLIELCRTGNIERPVEPSSKEKFYANLGIAYFSQGNIDVRRK